MFVRQQPLRKVIEMTMLRKLTLITAASSLVVTLFGAMATAEAAKAVFQRTKPNINVGMVGNVRNHKAKRTMRLRKRSAKSFRRAVRAPRNRFNNVRSLPRGAASVNQFKTRTPSPPPPSVPTKLTTEPRVVKDLYCGGAHHVPCDYIFTNYCALVGGTMSSSGTTCYHPWEW